MKQFLKPKLIFILILGFSSGLPLALTAGTLQAWMKDEQVNLGVIGLYSLVGLPYSLKFVWSPLLDRYNLKIGSRVLLGRRRFWLILSQLLLIVCIYSMGAFLEPARDTWLVAAMAFLIAFLSASQDIVIDAFRTEIVDTDELGPSASLTILGYRLAMLTSGAGALILADHLSWPLVYKYMALCMLPGLICGLVAKEPGQSDVPKSIKAAVRDPFVQYFSKSGAAEILLFIVLYKFGDVLAAAQNTPFLMEVGYTKSEIGYVSKAFGIIATIIGAIVGGALLARLGMRRALWGFGILQAVSTLGFSVIALLPAKVAYLAGCIAFENICAGLGNVVFIAFLMSLCDKRFTATQYALLTSLAAVPRTLLSSGTGYLALAVGWSWYFVICTVLAVPGLVLLGMRYSSWTSREEEIAS